MYASTPPLQAIRLILRSAATIDPDALDADPREVMLTTSAEHTSHAPATRALFMRLPFEDKDAQPGEVGKLHVCLYGTRDAARG